MQRLWGKPSGKKAAPPPSIEDTVDRMDKRVDSADARIKKLDDELSKLGDQIKRARPGPAQTRLKQRALTVLKQKRMYEGQRDQIENQRFNTQELQFAVDTIKDTQDHVACMKATASEMKVQQKKMNIGEIENMQDDLQDLYDDNQEIQEILGRSYAVQDEIDDADLEAELAGLEDDMLCGYVRVALWLPPLTPTRHTETTRPTWTTP